MTGRLLDSVGARVRIWLGRSHGDCWSRNGFAVKCLRSSIRRVRGLHDGGHGAIPPSRASLGADMGGASDAGGEGQ